MKKEMPEVWGRMNISYCDIFLPLNVAHEIQSLLARHAIGVKTVYRSSAPCLNALVDIDIPDVKTDRKEFEEALDARGIPANEYHEWAKVMVDTTANVEVIDPKVFANMRKSNE